MWYSMLIEKKKTDQPTARQDFWSRGNAGKKGRTKGSQGGIGEAEDDHAVLKKYCHVAKHR